MRKLLFFIYFVVVPYCMSPSWCLQYYHDNPDQRSFGVYDCDAVSVATGYRYSDFPTLSPGVTTPLDFACLTAFCLLMCYDSKYTNMSKG